MVVSEEVQVLYDRMFVPFITKEQIDNRVKELGQKINKDYRGLFPILIGVLNGAYMFTSDLSKNIDTPTDVSFVRCKSYNKIKSTGKLTFDLSFDKEKIKNRHIIIVEDIVDTGLTLRGILEKLKECEIASIKVATFLYKSTANIPIPLDYIGFEIENYFVTGYGLDYNGLGRNLNDLYKEI